MNCRIYTVRCCETHTGKVLLKCFSCSFWIYDIMFSSFFCFMNVMLTTVSGSEGQSFTSLSHNFLSVFTCPSLPHCRLILSFTLSLISLTLSPLFVPPLSLSPSLSQQDMQVSGVEDDSRALNIVIHKPSSNPHAKPLPILQANFIFADHIRCIIAKQRLAKGRIQARRMKMQRIAGGKTGSHCSIGQKPHHNIPFLFVQDSRVFQKIV